MKLIIQIPCYNERDTLPKVIADLPRKIEGIDSIAILIIDDGSQDNTSEIAEQVGVHYIVQLPHNRGLANAYMTGLDACLRLGADIVVNTDGDNQYNAADIPALVRPILEEQADIVIGDRQTHSLEHFSVFKRLLQRWGSHLVRKASGTEVKDATSGFRAINRKALNSLFVYNPFSYTLETIIQAGSLGLKIQNVPVRVNPQTRPSRLFRSIPHYLRRNGPVIFRSYAMYWPIQTFSYLATPIFFIGLFLIARFLYFFFENPVDTGHIQSLQIGVGAIIIAFITALMALLGDLLGFNRRLSEEILMRVRRLDSGLADIQKEQNQQKNLQGIKNTNAPPWTPENNNPH